MHDCTYYKMNFDYVQSNHHWAATFFCFIPLSLYLLLCVLILLISVF